MIFLLIIATLLKTQPLYIKGPTDSGAASTGCFRGGKVSCSSHFVLEKVLALIYFGTFLLSIGYWVFDNLKKRAASAMRVDFTMKEKIKFGGKYGSVISEN